MRMKKELIWAFLIVSLLAAIPVRAAPGPGIVGLWHFDTVDTAPSPYTTPDSSGLNNHVDLYPILSPPALVGGKFGKALEFDGYDDGVFVDDSSSLDFSSAITIEAWVYLHAYTNLRGHSIQTVAEKASAYYLNIQSGKLSFYWYGLTVPGYHKSPNTLPLNTWIHVAATYNGAYVKLYENGVQVYSLAVSGTGQTSNWHLGIGYEPYFPGTYPRYFDGIIDEARIWDQALTANQVAASYGLRLGTEIGQEDLNGDGYPDVIFTSAFYLGRQATGWSTSITITIVPVNPSVVIGYDIDGAGGVEPDEYVVKVRVTPKGTEASVSTGTLSPSGYSVTVTVTQGSPPCNSMHLWLYLSTGAHVGVNVQFLPYD